MFEIYVEEKLPSLQVDLMSSEGYDDATEKMIYNMFMKLMDRDAYGIINPTYKNKSTKIFQDLDEQLRGNIAQRKVDCSERLLDLR